MRKTRFYQARHKNPFRGPELVHRSGEAEGLKHRCAGGGMGGLLVCRVFDIEIGRGDSVVSGQPVPVGHEEFDPMVVGEL